MQRFLTGILCTLTLLAVGCSGKSDKPSPKSQRPAKADEAPLDDVKSAARSNNALAFDLHAKLPKKGNLFFSPFSISTALSMTYAGAKGDTATEMARTLHYPFVGERLHLAYAGLLGKLSDDGLPDGVTLSVANALWGPFDYNQAFLDINRDCYAANIRNIQLAGAEPTINKWAEEHTAGRIKDLLRPGILSADSVLVLTNAVYFKGEWESQFKKSDTSDQDFRVPGAPAIRVPMMRQTAKLPYAHVEGAKVLEMPYKGRDLSMIAILPDTDDGLAAVEKAITANKLEEWLNQLSKSEVRLQLPRFKIEGASVDINEPLIGLGMGRAFDRRADFSGIWGNPGKIWIDKVIHQAFVEVNEEGAEAAAATAVVLTKDKGSDKPRVVEFTADHPFLFLIRDNRTGCILFLGRLQSPK